MSSSRLIRLCGLAALVGLAVFTSANFALFVSISDSVALSISASANTWFVLQLLRISAMLLGLLGLIGIYARQAEKTGVLGLVAFLMTFFGWALYFALQWTLTF